MTIQATTLADNKGIKISINERFDFSLHQQFRDTYQNCNDNGAEFTLDLSNTTYMDSSALGMILLLKDHADKLSGKVVISKPNEAVNKILEIAQFHRLMPIEA